MLVAICDTRNCAAQGTVSSSQQDGTADASATTARMRNPVPTFSEGDQQEKLHQKHNEQVKVDRESTGSDIPNTASRRLENSSMSTEAAAAAAAAAGPTLPVGGDDDLGPEGAEAGSDDEGEEDIGAADQHFSISFVLLNVEVTMPDIAALRLNPRTFVHRYLLCTGLTPTWQRRTLRSRIWSRFTTHRTSSTGLSRR